MTDDGIALPPIPDAVPRTDARGAGTDELDRATLWALAALQADG